MATDYSQAERRALVGLEPLEYGDGGSLTAPAEASLISVADLRAYLYLEHQQDDALLETLLASATRQIEVYTGQVVTPRSRRATYSLRDGRRLPPNILIPENLHGYSPGGDAFPGDGIFSIAGLAEDLTAVTLGDMVAAPGVANVGLKIFPAGEWARGLEHDGAFLTAEWMPASLSDSDYRNREIIKQAILMLVGGGYENRESETAMAEVRLNPVVNRLLLPLRRHRGWRGWR